MDGQSPRFSREDKAASASMTIGRSVLCYETRLVGHNPMPWKEVYDRRGR
jgi:hypothetical protein